MGRRYSQIKRGGEYKAALDKYVDYLQNMDTRPTKRVQGGARGARRKLEIRHVKPFGIETQADEFYQVRCSAESLTDLGAAVGTRLTTAPNTATIETNKKFRPARFSAFKGSGAATYVQSKVTGLYYLKYEGDSYSLPFGAISDTEEEAAGSKIVKAAVLTAFGAADIKRISFTPERVPV